MAARAVGSKRFRWATPLAPKLASLCRFARIRLGSDYVRPMIAGYLEGRITERRVWADDLITVGFDCVLPPFEAGQFVNLALEFEGEPVRRSYSIASAPGAPLEVFVTRVTDGRLTPTLFELPVGSVVSVDPKSRGFFTLQHVPPAADLWLVGTGTGLGPYISMLRQGALWDRFERVVVVHGTRRLVHLAYADELRAEVERRPGRFAYVPLVSRDEPTAGVLAGRTTTALVDGSLERAAGFALDPARSHLMLCGNPDMITEMQAKLLERGLKKHRPKEPAHVTVEKYW